MLGEFLQGKRYRVRPCFEMFVFWFRAQPTSGETCQCRRGRKLVLSDDRMWSIVCSARAACPHSWRKGDFVTTSREVLPSDICVKSTSKPQQQVESERAM